MEDKIAQLKRIVEANSSPSIPSRAVLAFRDVACPRGWTRYAKGAGKTIIGVGDGPDSANYPLEAIGGKPTITIETHNLPSHSHDTLLGVDPGYAKWGTGEAKTAVYGVKAATAVTGRTSSTGKTPPDPISILPPYVALLYCEKD